MRHLLLAVLLLPSPAQAKKRNLDKAEEAARQAEERLKTPNLTPAETAEIRHQKAAAVEKIEAIASEDPKDVETQLDVSKSLASVEEAPRAIPYAERGLALAEKSGDPKLIRTALLTGSEVYYKAGKYELAGERAQRILKDNPKDRDALALYMQVKGRTSTPSGSNGGGSTAAAPAGAGVEASATATSPKAAPAMTNPASLEARRHLDAGWSGLTLDPAAAMKRFDAAVAADPKNASVHLERAKARQQTSDFRGALEDAAVAASLQPGLGAAYAARAEALRGQGRPDAEVLAAYEQAAKLDGAFTGAYRTLLAKVAQPASAGGSQAAKPGSMGGSASQGSLTEPPIAQAGRGLGALLALLTLAAVVIVAVLRRRSDEEGSRSR
ncbi:MAG: hypothetical protein HY923_05450 [Elusimicrobia bacterium]|nr:hypothetical protein [Elusimicrobiota bacterium]